MRIDADHHPFDARPELRSGEPTADAPDAVLEALLRGRWSCRAFLPDPVPRELMDRMFGMAQLAPSWCNTQPWELHVTSGAATHDFREGLIAHLEERGGYSAPDYTMPEGYTGVRRERRRAAGWQLYEAVGIARGDREASTRQTFRNFELFGAPHLAVVTAHEEQGVYGAVDSGIYLGALLLAARSLGIGAIPQAALARLSPFLREYFAIDDSRKVVVAVSFGYPDLDHPANAFRTARAGVGEAVTYHG
ncbi:nitroreductase [Nocardiopsis synnemataformans]|uniref:nitroreductase n=1 Tax=Nocardiopsis synnemataformans TaxID=61305 RepID=UPI003EBB4942